MTKILLSLVMIVAVASFAVGATKAYFTSPVQINDMTFATGTLIMKDSSESWMTHVSFTNLKPGDTIRKWIVLENGGTLDIASLTAQAINKNDTFGLLDQIKVSAIGWVGQPYDSYFTPGWGTGGQPVTWLSTAQDLLSLSAIQYHNDGTPPSVIAPGVKDTIILDFTVPTGMGNEWQGKTADFDLLFTAEQSHTGTAYF